MLSPVQGGGQRELLVLLSPSALLGSCFGGSQASNKCRSHTVDHALFLFPWFASSSPSSLGLTGSKGREVSPAQPSPVRICSATN